MWDMEDERDSVIEYFASAAFQQELKQMNEQEIEQQQKLKVKAEADGAEAGEDVVTANGSNGSNSQAVLLLQGLLTDKNLRLLAQYSKQAGARAKSHKQQKKQAMVASNARARAASAAAGAGAGAAAGGTGTATAAPAAGGMGQLSALPTVEEAEEANTSSNGSGEQ
jgi:hypothetical protein